MSLKVIHQSLDLRNDSTDDLEDNRSNSKQMNVDDLVLHDDHGVSNELDGELQEIYNRIVKWVANEGNIPEQEVEGVVLVVARQEAETAGNDGDAGDGVIVLSPVRNPMDGVEELVGHIRNLSTDDSVSPYYQTCQRLKCHSLKLSRTMI